MFLASTSIQAAGISGLSGLDGSMGLGGHLRHLDLALIAMSSAWLVPNGLWRGSLFAKIPHV